MKKNERSDALRILIGVLQDNIQLSHLMTPAADLSPFSKELCFGVTRHYVRLAAIADRLIKKRPKGKDTDVWVCLLMGLYQLHALRTPDYAVVQETVALLNQLKKPWAKGLVNAVLRTYCREKETLLLGLAADPAYQYGHPSWLIQRIQKAWPNHWESIVTANNEHPPMTLRVNHQKISTEDYLSQLRDANKDANPHSFVPSALSVTTPCDVQELPGFVTGHVSVQDAAAQLAASLLSLEPNQRVLDVCAAPGGKTCHILETEPNLSTCIAGDIDPQRLSRIQQNLDRLQLHATVLQGDAAHPESWWDGLPFDRILLDAPCSATGVIRRHPDIKLLRTEQDITDIAALQETILKAIWPLLSTGGILVYATCSIMPEENEQQISQFINTHTDARTLPQKQPWGHDTGHGLQILPGEHGMDGFFYAVLVKTP